MGYTIVRMYDGRRIVAHNTVTAGQITINLSSPDVLAVIDFHLAYGSDFSKARNLAVAAAERRRAAPPRLLLFPLRDDGVILARILPCSSYVVASDEAND